MRSSTIVTCSLALRASGHATLPPACHTFSRAFPGGAFSVRSRPCSHSPCARPLSHSDRDIRRLPHAAEGASTQGVIGGDLVQAAQGDGREGHVAELL